MTKEKMPFYKVEGELREGKSTFALKRGFRVRGDTSVKGMAPLENDWVLVCPIVTLPLVGFIVLVKVLRGDVK